MCWVKGRCVKLVRGKGVKGVIDVIPVCFVREGVVVLPVCYVLPVTWGLVTCYLFPVALCVCVFVLCECFFIIHSLEIIPKYLKHLKHSPEKNNLTLRVKNSINKYSSSTWLSNTWPSTHPGLELRHHPPGAGESVGLDVLDADVEVLHFDLEGLLNGLDLDVAFGLLVKQLHGTLELNGGLAEVFVTDLWC